MDALVVGLDLGTTTFKAVAFDARGLELAGAQVPTPWRTDAGVPSMAARDALDSVVSLIGQVVGGRVATAIGVTGMAESGFLIDAEGLVRSAAIAWHAPVGADEAADQARTFGLELAARTGLRYPERSSAVKVRWLLRESPRPGMAWASLPEWIVTALGGARIAELSLAARTGMLDVVARAWWPDGVAWAGLDPAACPPLAPAGTPAGLTDGSGGLPRGSVLAIAGHDHLVASVGAGALSDDAAFDSFGTGEAVLRTVPPAHRSDQLTIAVSAGLSRGPHVLSGRDYVMAALGSGRLMGEVLAALDVPLESREALDQAAMLESAALVPDVIATLFDVDGHLAGDPATFPPALAWRAVLEFTATRCRRALDTGDALYGARDGLFAAGGWFRSPTIRDLRRDRVGTSRIPLCTEAGSRGAGRIAALAAGLIDRLETWPDAWLPEPGQTNAFAARRHP